MKGLARNIKYWLYYSGKTFCIVAAMIIGICVMTTLFDGEFNLLMLAHNLAYYLVLMTAILTMVYAYTNITIVMPMTVSLGSTRLPSIIGMEVAQHIFTLVGAGIAVIITVVSDPVISGVLAAFWPLAIALLFIIHAFGNLISFFSLEFGKTLGMILYIASVLIVSIGVAIFFMSVRYSKFDMTAFTTGTQLLIALAALVLDVIFAMLVYLGIRKKNLNF